MSCHICGDDPSKREICSAVHVEIIRADNSITYDITDVIEATNRNVKE